MIAYKTEIQKGVGVVGRKKEKKIDLNNLTPEEVMKYEIARELGLLDKVLESGWRTLTAKETGRIGGLVTKRKREARADKAEKTTEE